MPINWNDSTVLERVFIATLASLDNKVDIKEIARIYGGEMTYHALENRLRKWKKEATALKDEAAGVPAPAKSPVKPKVKKDAIPQKNAAGGVKGSRVTKIKAPAKPKIKAEPVFEDEEEMLMDGAGPDAGGAVGGGEDDELDVDEFM